MQLSPHSTELVWKVARYTSAGPLFFKEFENYVDGGVLANNPCNQGLAKIQNFHHDLHKKLPIALVVSIGTGIYPPETLGRVDAQDFLFFGRHWLDFSEHFKARTGNLISLLTNAVCGMWYVHVVFDVVWGISLCIVVLILSVLYKAQI